MKKVERALASFNKQIEVLSKEDEEGGIFAVLFGGTAGKLEAVKTKAVAELQNAIAAIQQSIDQQQNIEIKAQLTIQQDKFRAEIKDVEQKTISPTLKKMGDTLGEVVAEGLVYGFKEGESPAKKLANMLKQSIYQAVASALSQQFTMQLGAIFTGGSGATGLAGIAASKDGSGLDLKTVGSALTQLAATSGVPFFGTGAGGQPTLASSAYTGYSAYNTASALSSGTFANAIIDAGIKMGSEAFKTFGVEMLAKEGVGGQVANALPYLGSVVSLAQGNAAGAGIQAATAYFSGGNPIAMAIAAVVSSLLGGRDEEKPELSLSNFKRGSNAKADAQLARGAPSVVSSPFGILKATAQHIPDGDGADFAKKLANKLLKPIADLDKLIAANLKDEQLTAIKDALDGWTTGTQDSTDSFNSKLIQRVSTVSDTVGGMVDKVADLTFGTLQEEYTAIIAAASIGEETLSKYSKAYEEVIASQVAVTTKNGKAKLDANKNQIFDYTALDQYRKDIVGKDAKGNEITRLETDTEVYTRLVTSIEAVNLVFDGLDKALFSTELSGMAAADALVSAYGSLENFVKITSEFNALYGTPIDNTRKQLNDFKAEFQKLGLVFSPTGEALKAQVDSIDDQIQAASFGTDTKLQEDLALKRATLERFGISMSSIYKTIDATLKTFQTNVEKTSANFSTVKTQFKSLGLRGEPDMPGSGQEAVDLLAKLVQKGDATAVLMYTTWLNAWDEINAITTANAATFDAELSTFADRSRALSNEFGALSNKFGSELQSLGFEIPTTAEAANKLRDAIKDQYGANSELYASYVSILPALKGVIDETKSFADAAEESSKSLAAAQQSMRSSFDKYRTYTADQRIGTISQLSGISAGSIAGMSIDQLRSMAVDTTEKFVKNNPIDIASIFSQAKGIVQGVATKYKLGAKDNVYGSAVNLGELDVSKLASSLLSDPDYKEYSASIISAISSGFKTYFETGSTAGVDNAITLLNTATSKIQSGVYDPAGATFQSNVDSLIDIREGEITTAQTVADEWSKAAEFSGKFAQQLEDFGLTGLAATLRTLQREFEGNKIAAEELGVSIDDITKLYGLQKDAAISAFREGIQDKYRAPETTGEALTRIRGSAVSSKFAGLETMSPEQIRARLVEVAGTIDVGMLDVLNSLTGSFDTLINGAQKAIDDRGLAVDSALTGVREAVDRAIKDVQKSSDDLIKGWNKEIDALQPKIDNAQTAFDLLKAIFDRISDGVKSLRDQVNPELSRTQARGYIDMTLALAKAGVLPNKDNQEKLSDAIGKVVNGDQGLYATKADFIRAQLVQAGKLDELGGLVDKQKTLDELALDQLKLSEKNLRTLITNQEESTRQQIEALNAQYDEAVKMVDELRGVNGNLVTVSGAIAALSTAVLALKETELAKAASAAKAAADASSATKAHSDLATNGTGSGYGSTTITLPDGSGYTSASGVHVGRPMTAAEVPVKMGESDLRTTLISMANAQGGMIGSEERGSVGSGGLAQASLSTLEMIAKYQNLPGYAVGTSFVPNDMPANIHKGEIIVDPQSSEILRRYGINLQMDNGMIRELQALREEVALMRAETKATAVATTKTSRTLDRLIPDGDALQVSVGGSIDGGAV